MRKRTTPPRCDQEVSLQARVSAEALIVHHLNPLLHGRQELAARIEALRTEGEASNAETMALLCLESAYRDGLKLLRWVLTPCKEPIQ
ncbi:hypothetical protein NNJEOMEG_00161 [Fundidesulfovibrio magnetotacticus]|uniref:Uncharacterized protein n=1 Tax=Fundidesulfovibrio magnetotacticus TaxID=2730080 RepID=A0A6V8LRV6_9BACT|nr:hypothetical protein [Fundidesulfovibrio magnetotacticus]GFK92337.1 hypothetical protein NNJEOMEG_00161 [Fundidesulfovibrio magnetotacticus]